MLSIPFVINKKGVLFLALAILSHTLLAHAVDQTNNSPCDVLNTDSLVIDEDWCSYSLVHAGKIIAAEFSTNGSLIISAGTDNVIRIWDHKTGRQISAFMPSQSSIAAMVLIKPSNQILTSHADGSISLFEIGTTKKLKEFETNKAPSTILEAPNSGNHFISSGPNGILNYWSIDDENKPLLQVETHDNSITAGAINQKRKLALTAGPSLIIKLWDLSNGKLIHEFKGHHREVTKLAFIPNSSLAASISLDESVRIWDLKQGELIKTLRGGRQIQKLTSIKISADGKLALVGERDGKARLWDLQEFKEVHSYIKSTGVSGWKQSSLPATAVDFSPNQKEILSAGYSGRINVWERISGKERSYRQSHKKTITSLVVQVDESYVISASLDRAIHFWDFQTSAMLQSIHEKELDSSFLGGFTSLSQHQNPKIS